MRALRIAAFPHVGPMALAGSIAVVAGLIGFLRDRLIALEFGIGPATGEFFVALAPPLYVASVFASLATSGFMPTYVDTRDATLARQVLALHLTAAAAVVLAGLLLMPLLPETYLGVGLVFIAIVPLMAATSVLTAVAQAHRDYFFVNALPILPQAAAVVAILAAAQHGIVVAAYGIVAGYALMLLAATLRARRYAVTPWPARPERTASFASVLRQYGALIIGVAAMGANAMIDQLMAAWHGLEQVSVLVYGSRVTTLVIGLTAATVSSILLTEFSHLSARADGEGLRRLARRYEVMFMAAMAIVATALCAFSAPIISLLFGTAGMTLAQVAEIAFVQSLYVWQLPFYVGGLVYVHRLGAGRRNEVVTRIAVVNCVLNILLNLLLGAFWGVAGIAAATTLVYLASWIQLRLHFREA